MAEPEHKKLINDRLGWAVFYFSKFICELEQILAKIPPYGAIIPDIVKFQLLSATKSCQACQAHTTLFFLCLISPKVSS